MTSGAANEAQGKVFFDLAMSLDGFTSGPNVGEENPMGIGGESLHDWMFAGKTEEQLHAQEEAMFTTVGALILGRRTVDLGIGPWGENPPYHAPCFVLTTRPHEPIVKQGGTTFYFVTDGIESALAQAKAAAGGQNVQVHGGANAVRQYLRAGLIDEFRIHLAPILLGGGARLFEGVGPENAEVELVSTVAAPDVTHLTYRVVK